MIHFLKNHPQCPTERTFCSGSPVSIPPASGLSFSRSRVSLLLSLAFGLAAFGTGFGQQTATKSVDLKNAKSLNAEVRFNAGTIKLTAQNTAKADSRFTYTRTNWKPEVKFNEASGQGRLTILQPEEKNINMGDKDRNDWDIKLPAGITTDLKLRMGAGEGNIDLRNAKLRQLEMDAGAGEFNVNLAGTSVATLDVNAGVGELTIDLTGNRANDLTASVNGGIGEVKLILPRNVGVRVKINGIGSIEAGGLKKQDGYYVNDAYGKSAHSLNITVNGGLGSLQLDLK